MPAEVRESGCGREHMPPPTTTFHVTGGCCTCHGFCFCFFSVVGAVSPSSQLLSMELFPELCSALA